jgi:hypothetical protein
MNLFAPVVAYPAFACAVLLTLSNLFMTYMHGTDTSSTCRGARGGPPR